MWQSAWLYWTDSFNHLFVLLDEKAVPTLSQHPNYTSVYVEEQVTFMCEVEIDSTGWEYQWFKKNLQGPIPNTDPTTTNYTIKSASAKHEDEFWCRAQRGVYQSEPSGPIQIQVLCTFIYNTIDTLTIKSQFSDPISQFFFFNSFKKSSLE